MFRVFKTNYCNHTVNFTCIENLNPLHADGDGALSGLHKAETCNKPNVLIHPYLKVHGNTGFDFVKLFFLTKFYV